MTWDERQHALLQAMGIRLWQPPAAPAALSKAAAAESTVPPAADAQAQTASGAERQAVPCADAVSRPEPMAVPVAGPPPTPAPVPRAQRPAAVANPALAALDWGGLRDTVASCRACGLCEGRTQTVFGVGHPQAHWLVVGEAPGEEEDRQGEPFVGASGQLLDAMLRALHLTRAEDGPAPLSQRVYITNTVKCRPPRNRNPAPDEIQQCEPYLLRQIELLRPRMILAMGRFAVQALLRSNEPIGRLRGTVHRYQGLPLVVTYHPAYLLRNLPDKARAWEDLCLAASVME